MTAPTSALDIKACSHGKGVWIAFVLLMHICEIVNEMTDNLIIMSVIMYSCPSFTNPYIVARGLYTEIEKWWELETAYIAILLL